MEVVEHLDTGGVLVDEDLHVPFKRIGVNELELLR